MICALDALQRHLVQARMLSSIVKMDVDGLFDG